MYQETEKDREVYTKMKVLLQDLQNDSGSESVGDGDESESDWKKYLKIIL